MNRTVLIHDDHYQSWVFDSYHPTQGRRFNNAARELIVEINRINFNKFRMLSPRLATKEELCLVHTETYVSEVIEQGICNEWQGEKPNLGQLARLFVGGTLAALEELLSDNADIAIHYPGAKHHAQQDRSSGFCVFNDFAIAAKIATSKGYNVAIFDLDAHHGDGTENLLRNDSVLTYSVHDSTVFPGTGFSSEPALNLYNYPLAAGSGDSELMAATEEFIELAANFGASMIFIAAGADGHSADPLSTLNYSTAGIANSVRRIKSRFIDLPMLIGGAGGYLPDDITPEVWASAAVAAITATNESSRKYFDLSGVNFDCDQEVESIAKMIIENVTDPNTPKGKDDK